MTALQKLHADLELLEDEILTIYEDLKVPIMANDHGYVGQLVSALLVRMGGRQQIFNVINKDDHWPIT